ncbi:MAG: heavy-metal-associated domain-containing protein [Candidatus Altiarchaeota archaeon]|nr:heavy-metal-associated domain-containing protein [Candidatus Altiarchaeota archaeon]
MSQKKLSKITFKVDGLYTSGHARRCEAMIRNAAGGIEGVQANEIAGIVTIVFDVKMQTPHTIRDVVDETGYTVITDRD